MFGDTSATRARIAIAGALIAGALIAITAGAAHAQRPRAGTAWDREQQRLHDEVVRRGREPAAIVPLIELGSDWEHAPARTLALLHAIGANRRVMPSLRAYARAYELALSRRGGDLAAATALAGELGYVRRWRVLGPFDNAGKRGFATPLAPERALDAETDLGAEHEGLERAVRWSALPDLGAHEVVPLDAFLTPSSEVCALAETFVELDRARPVALLGGATGALRVYWNGVESLVDPVYRGVDTDRVAAVVAGRAGWNRVLVKVCSDQRDVSFVLRVAEPDGTPIAVRADPEGARVASPAAGPPPALPPAPQTILAGLEAAIAARPDDAAAHEALARYLAYTSGSDPAENRVRDLAVRATELGATPRNLIFAARQQASRAEAMRFVEQAVALAPRDPQVALEHAAWIADGPGGERALRMLEAISPETVAGLGAMVVRAGLLERLGLRESAHAIYASLVARVPGSPHYLRLLASSEDGLGHEARASELRRQVLAISADDAAARRRLVEEALVRVDRDDALAIVEGELALHPFSSATMGWASDVYDALSDESAAIDVLRAAVELDPGDAGTRIALGRRLLRMGRRDAALASLREALALRPQDAATRQLVEQIQPEPRPDEAYATPIETILSRRRPDGEWPATVLHDLEVHTVHESGLSSSFRQVVTQIHDDEGARGFRSFAIAYEPGTQWVDLRAARVYRGGQVLTSYRVGERSMAQPEYRIYYSARQLVVTYPVLEPGDVIEIRYRVEDMAARNAYADYFGALRALQRAVPLAHVEHVFLTPASRRFYFNTPSIRVAHEQRTEGARRIDRFVAADVPALRSEPGMPGYAEVAPYLHVSTYESWDDVARWWWGLIEDQLQPDASLERTVRDLIAGAPDVRTRVQRIYAWATDRVRYVGLEFGIHGHLPYRVTDVVERGFGDCKDTASLLYTMFRIAGIEARIVLVRTRPNGAIERAPASLAAFDHAIAYVPELDLFLDGTAEHAGTTELPTMDQGAMGLIVGPGGTAEMRTLPMRAADTSGRRRELRIELARDGGATLRAREELRGPEAMGARGTYDGAGTRRERLTRALAGMFPGIELTEESFEHLDDREQPLGMAWVGRVPQIGERHDGVVRLAPSTLGALVRALAPLPQRRHPLELGPPFHYRERRVVPIGELRIEEVPPGGAAESAFGRVAVRYVRRGSEVVAETDLTLARERVSPEEYPAFRAWLEQADALLGARIAIGGVE